MRLGLTLLLLIAPVAVFAQSPPTVAQFLRRADPLADQGVAAILSPDYIELKQEAKAARNAVRDREAAAAAAGRRHAICLPEEKLQIDPDELLAYLHTIPPAKRGMSLETAFAGLMKQKYPCRA